MKRSLIAIAILFCSIASIAAPTAIAPWDKPLTKSVKVFTGTLDWYHIWEEPAAGPYGGIRCDFLRIYPSDQCEYMNFQLYCYYPIRYGFPRTTTWVWGWISCTLVIPANQHGHFYYDMAYPAPGCAWNAQGGFDSDYIFYPWDC